MFGCVADSDHTEAELQAPSNPSAQYRVVVAFSSPGTGIDLDAFERTTAHFRRYDIDLSPDLFSWGLEGERNLCFTLQGLNTEAQSQFVLELDAIAETAQFVSVHSNAACDVVAH